MSNKLTIAIETSGRVGSAGIGCGDELIAVIPFSGFMKHSAELFTTLEKLLYQANSGVNEVGQVHITAGPGSFTGLRIAVTAAKMFYFTQKSQIVAADSMDVIAENATRYAADTGKEINCIATILDAKKDIFFAAVFDKIDGNWKKCLNTQAISAENLLQWLQTNNKQSVGLLGEGLVYYADKFKSPLTYLLDEAYWSATAEGLFCVGRQMTNENLFADPYALTPQYIRDADAVEKKR